MQKNWRQSQNWTTRPILAPAPFITVNSCGLISIQQQRIEHLNGRSIFMYVNVWPDWSLPLRLSWNSRMRPQQMRQRTVLSSRASSSVANALNVASSGAWPGSCTAEILYTFDFSQTAQNCGSRKKAEVRPVGSVHRRISSRAGEQPLEREAHAQSLCIGTIWSRNHAAWQRVHPSPHRASNTPINKQLPPLAHKTNTAEST